MEEKQLHPDIKKTLSRKNRNANVQTILKSLDVDQLNFNTVILGFTDIIQSSFYNYLMAQCKSQSERKKLQDSINLQVNEVIDTLNENGGSNPEDMVVLTTVMIECINKALMRQNNANGKITPTLGEKK